MEKNFQDYLAWTYFGRDSFDREEFARFEKTLQGTTRFIDVGASHGVYTCHANKILKGAEIIAIEADPERFHILQKNLDKWSSESSNTLRCIHAAASDEEERSVSSEVTFYTTGTQISGGFFSVDERSDDYAPITVPLVCVDDYFDKNSQTFVKIDVEGAELRVLRGAMKHIEAGNTKFFTEISKWGDRQRGTSALEVLRFCWRNGLRADRRLRSDYLLSPEPNAASRFRSIARCVPPLGLRVAFDTIVPMKIRTWYERRLNVRRLSRFEHR